MYEGINLSMNFLDKALEIQNEIIQLRRSIHQHPELGKQEFRTSSIVEGYLQGLDIATQRIAGTGIVGLLEGSYPGRTVAFRADMDALPIQELNQFVYASRNPGKMHACGHDAHTAALLGAAKILASCKKELAGNVKFFFQPNEEQEGGAADMIQSGCLDHPKVNAVFGCHVNPEIPAGKIGVSYGKSYAASNPFSILIHGKGSHGAEPHKGVDTIAIGAQIVNTLQTIVSRSVDPVDSAVVTVGTFHGGSQGNILAEDTQLTGIIRTLDPASRKKVVEKVRLIAQGIGESMGASVQVNIENSYPALITNTEMTDLLKASASSLLGEDCVLVMASPTLGTEDFAFFLEKVPGTFFQLGSGFSEGTKNYPLHSAHFSIDESCLPIAAAIHAQAAYDFLSLSAYRKEVAHDG